MDHDDMMLRKLRELYAFQLASVFDRTSEGEDSEQAMLAREQARVYADMQYYHTGEK